MGEWLFLSRLVFGSLARFALISTDLTYKANGIPSHCSSREELNLRWTKNCIYIWQVYTSRSRSNLSIGEEMLLSSKKEKRCISSHVVINWTEEIMTMHYCHGTKGQMFNYFQHRSYFQNIVQVINIILRHETRAHQLFAYSLRRWPRYMTKKAWKLN